MPHRHSPHTLLYLLIPALITYVLLFTYSSREIYYITVFVYLPIPPAPAPRSRQWSLLKLPQRQPRTLLLLTPSRLFCIMTALPTKQTTMG